MLEAFGIDAAAEAVYFAILEQPDSGVAGLAGQLGWREDLIRAALDELARLTLLRPSWENPDVLRAVSPDIALEGLVARQEADLVHQQNEIATSRAALAMLLAEYANHRPEGLSDASEQLTGIDTIRDRLTYLARNTCHEWLSLMPGGTQSIPGLEASTALDEQMLDRGVDVRAVYLDSVCNDPSTFSYARSLIDLGGQVRTVPALPIRMIIIDREQALVPTDPMDSAAGAVLIHGAGTLAALLAFFEQIWGSARHLGTPVRRDDHGLTDQERELLRFLYQGHTDEVVARKLGLSTRTARRVTADLMTRLGARSRFQAGARAAELGWLRYDPRRREQTRPTAPMRPR
jgi:DNA-binding CsgD family transcriptional regulator